AVVSLPQNTPHFAFSEIEVLSEGRNVALEAPVSASDGLSYRGDALDRITDGLNYYGDILPMRDWMHQLARRHDLEAERPIVLTLLNRHYVRQKNTVKALIWTAVLLAAGTATIILVVQRRHRRHLTRIRERIAADLHDELGANFHTIGLLSQLIEK